MSLPEQRICQLLGRLGWNRSECAIAPQPMGSTNESYKCSYRDEEFILRLGTRQAGILSINRHAEEAALKLVSKLSCGANLVYYDLETGNMVTKYIHGRELAADDLNDPKRLAQMVHVLKAVHTQETAFTFDFYGDVERRLEVLKEHNIPLHPEFSRAYKIYRICMERNSINAKLHFGLCHGDPFVNNFVLSDSGQLFLLDYEYAGMGDVFFDLSCIAPGLTPEKQKELLCLYFGECTPFLLEKLYDFFIINLMWNGTWAYVKSCDVPKEVFDYIQFGDFHMDSILKSGRPKK